MACWPAYLLWLQIADDRVDAVQYLLNERHHFPDLNLHEMAPTLLGDLDERVTGHVLDTVVRLCNTYNVSQAMSWTPSCVSVTHITCHRPCPGHRRASL